MNVNLMPGRALAGLRAGRMVERNLMLYRRTWIILLSGFFEPVLYLLGIGFGIGSLVHQGVALPGGGVISYPAFVAPALMATAAMNGAVYESTFNLYHKLRNAKIYDAILTTPLGVADIALGEITWALMRGSLYSLGFILFMFLLGLVESPLAILDVPGALLIGFSFAAVGTAATTFLRSWQDFDLVQLVLLPLFLFSATFFPLSAYPAALQVVVQLTPLYHGIDLLRGLSTGRVGLATVVDIAYLAALGLGGLSLTAARLRALLLR